MNDFGGLLNTVTQGDCLEVMKRIPDGSIDVVITSPPYFNARKYSQWESYDIFLEFIEKTFKDVYRILKPGRMCAVNISVIIQPRKKRNEESRRIALPFHFVSLMEEIGFKFLEDIIWIKPEGAAKNRNGGFFQHRQPIAYKPNIGNEYIFVFQKPMRGLIDKLLKQYDDLTKEVSLVHGDYERSNVWEINPETKVKHPAPFPVELPEKIIRYYSYVGEVIFDPFMGSGTTAVAAIKTGRQFIGIEKEPKYVEIAKRIIDEALTEKKKEKIL